MAKPKPTLKELLLGDEYRFDMDIPPRGTTKSRLGIAKNLLHYDDDIFESTPDEIDAFYESKLEP